MKFLKRVSLILGGLLVGLILMELLARLFLPYPKRQIDLIRMRAPDLQMDAGTDLKNLTYNPFIQRRPFSEWTCDGKNPEKMNNEGFRDKDFVLQKNSKKRIAVLGDSFTEGWMAPKGSAFPIILEQKLGEKFEVMDFGLANRSPLRYLALYADIVKKYHPDIVIVCLYKNDLAEDEALRPYVTFDPHGIPTHFDFEKYFAHTPRMPQTQWEKRMDKLQWNLCKYSRVYPYTKVAFGIDPEFKKRILDAPPPTSIPTLWSSTERYLQILKQLVESDHSKFLLAYAPDLSDFDKLDPLYTYTAQFAEKTKTPFFKAEKFLSPKEKDSLYIPGDGHFSTHGHEIYAEELAEWLKKNMR